MYAERERERERCIIYTKQTVQADGRLRSRSGQSSRAGLRLTSVCRRVFFILRPTNFEAVSLLAIFYPPLK